MSQDMKDPDKTKLVGINHLVLEVNDLDAALEFYGNVFEFELRGRDDDHRMVFIDMGDQFLVLSEGRSQAPDGERHFGLVVEDRSDVPALVEKFGGEMLDTEAMDFRDPWGNHVQVVQYDEVQFTKTGKVMQALGASPKKTKDARAQLEDKGLT